MSLPHAIPVLLQLLLRRRTSLPPGAALTDSKQPLLQTLDGTALLHQAFTPAASFEPSAEDMVSHHKAVLQAMCGASTPTLQSLGKPTGPGHASSSKLHGRRAVEGQRTVHVDSHGSRPAKPSTVQVARAKWLIQHSPMQPAFEMKSKPLQEAS